VSGVNNTTAPIRSRIAPTPSGYLHIGNAFSFVLTWLLVRKHGGSLHLRIDDLDAERKRPEYVQDIFETLDWLQLDYDTGARSVEEFEDVYAQRHRLPAYHVALEQLTAQPNVKTNVKTNIVFACECSRTQILRRSPSGRYPGTCQWKHLPLSTPETALRLVVEDAAEISIPSIVQTNTIALGQTMGSFVVRRRDGTPAYHLASVVDDCTDGITHIVRGADLLPSTAAQLLLAERLGGSIHTRFSAVWFLHHPLLLDAAGRKLSKSEGSTALKTLRSEGASPNIVYQRVASALGFSAQQQWTLKSLLEAVTFDVTFDAKFDMVPH
jgi:glutamyl-tRNA synthetase